MAESTRESQGVPTAETMPAMPVALERLLERMHASQAESSSLTGTMLSNSRTTTSATVVPPTAVMPTSELLRLVDDLYGTFRSVAEQCARTSSSSSPSDSRSTVAQDLALNQSLDAFEERVAGVQGGIRSKLQQTARFAMIAHLQSEIATRNHIVTRLNMVLETARKTLPAPTTSSADAA